MTFSGLYRSSRMMIRIKLIFINHKIERFGSHMSETDLDLERLYPSKNNWGTSVRTKF